MSIGDQLVSSIKTIVMMNERINTLTAELKDTKAFASARLADHESRLTRIETIIEIARPDGAVLRITPGRAASPSRKLRDRSGGDEPAD